MAHTKETSVVRSNTLEQWRQKTNKISYDLGSLYDLDPNLTDSILEFTATEGQTNFYSDALAIAFAPQQEVDNTGGSIILVPNATVDAGFVADERVFQGPEGSETWQATIVSVSDDKIIVKQSVGNFDAGEDIVLTDDTNITLAAADISSIIAESYKTVYSEIYVDGVEQEQSMVTAGFHAPAYNSRIVLAGSPTIPDSFVEGATIYQGTLGSETFVGTILYVEGTSNIHLKSVTSGTFSPSVMVKVGNGDTNNRVLAANISAMVQIDQDHACMLELHTPASAGDVVKVVFFNTVRALNELQDDIGVTENLTTTAGNLVGAVNELDAEIGNTSEFSTVSATNNTVSTAIQKLHSEIGNITTLDALISATTLVGASNELQTDIGNVANLTTTATTVVTAINEHENDIGDMSFTGLDATDISAAIRELRTDLGDVTATNMGTTASTVVTAIKEHETDIGNMTFTGLDADNISGAIRELRVDLGDVTAENMGTTASTVVTAVKELEGEINTLNTRVEPTQAFNTNFTATTIMDGINELMTDLGDVTAENMGTTASTVVTAIKEHETDIGNMTLTGLDAADLSAAIRELRVNLGDVTAENMGTTADNAVGAILELETEIDTLNTRVEPTQAFNETFTATTIMDGINELMTDLGDVTATNMGTTASTVVTAISELHTELGDVTAENMGTTATTVVGAISELETEIDTLNTRVEPTQAFDTWFNVYDEQEPPQLIPNTIMDGINKLANDKFNLTSGSDQTVNSNVTFTTGNTLTVPTGATLDVSAGTLLVGGGGSTLTFDTAFITLGSDAATEGLQIDRSEIDGVTVLDTTDAKLQWNEGKVGTGSSNTSHRAWQLVGFTNDSDPVVSTSDIVTFYNAKDLVSNNTETNITVGWDAVNQNFDFALNNAISLTSVTASGNVGADTMTTGTLATTGNVTVGGNLTVSGTVTTVNSETVTIADNIIVLNSNEAGVPGEDAGIEVERGTSTNVALAWDESEDRWVFTNNGSTYYNIPIPTEYDKYTSWTIKDGDSSTYTITSGDTLQIAEGTGINSDFTADDILTITNTKPFDYLSMVDGDGTSLSLGNTNTWTFTEGSGSGATIDINHTDTVGPAYATTFTVTNTDKGSSQNIFKNVAVSGQNTIVADNNNDTLTVAAGNAMTLTTNSSTDTLTIAHTDTSTLSGQYGGNNNGIVIEDITVDSNGHITAIGTRDLDGRFDNYNNWSLFVDGVDKDNVTSGEKVDFAATAPLSVAHSISSGNVLTWTHDASGVTAGSYGQTGAEDGQYIKSITVNATGHITGISSDDFDDRYDNYTSWNAKDHDGTTYTITSGDTLQYKEGSGMDVNFTADDVLTFTNTDRGSSQAIFKNVAVSGQNTIVADNNNDTLTVVGGGAITVTTDSGTDTLTIAHSDTSTQASVNNTGRTYIQDITLDTYGHVTGLVSATETVVNTDTTYSISAQDVTGGKAIRLSGSDDTNDDVVFAAGTNVSLSRTDDKITITSTNTWRPIHDTPVDGSTTTSISSNWAFDNVKTAVPANAVFTDNDTTYGHSFVDSGVNVIHRLAAGGSGTGNDDLTFKPGGIVTLTPSGDNMTINAPGTNITVTQTVNNPDLVEINSSTGNNGVLLVASTLYAGAMSSGDKSKLNGIDTGAEVNQNAFSNIEVYKNTGVGGATLVGTASADSKTDTFAIYTGSGITATQGDDYITISNEADQLNHIDRIGKTGTGQMSLDMSTSGVANFWASGTTGTLEFQMQADGDFHADGNITAYSTTTSSDAKLKTNIQKVDGALDKVCALDGVTFEWIRDGKESAGVIAQNVEEVLPRAVSEVKDLNSDDTRKVVDYNQLSALFIEAIKELKDENKHLRAEIEALKDINK